MQDNWAIVEVVPNRNTGEKCRTLREYRRVIQKWNTLLMASLEASKIKSLDPDRIIYIRSIRHENTKPSGETLAQI